MLPALWLRIKATILFPQNSISVCFIWLQWAEKAKTLASNQPEDTGPPDTLHALSHLRAAFHLGRRAGRSKGMRFRSKWHRLPPTSVERLVNRLRTRKPSPSGSTCLPKANKIILKTDAFEKVMDVENIENTNAIKSDFSETDYDDYEDECFVDYDEEEELYDDAEDDGWENWGCEE